jgi:carbon starvation protein
MVWLVSVTLTASYQKIFHPNPRIGLLSYANQLAARLAAHAVPSGQLPATQRLVFNNRLDAAVTALFAALVVILLVEASLEWFRILAKREPAVLHEAPYVATGWAEGD